MAERDYKVGQERGEEEEERKGQGTVRREASCFIMLCAVDYCNEETGVMGSEWSMEPEASTVRGGRLEGSRRAGRSWAVGCADGESAR